MKVEKERRRRKRIRRMMTKTARMVGKDKSVQRKIVSVTLHVSAFRVHPSINNAFSDFRTTHEPRIHFFPEKKF